MSKECPLCNQKVILQLFFKLQSLLKKYTNLLSNNKYHRLLIIHRHISELDFLSWIAIFKRSIDLDFTDSLKTKTNQNPYKNKYERIFHCLLFKTIHPYKRLMRKILMSKRTYVLSFLITLETKFSCAIAQIRSLNFATNLTHFISLVVFLIHFSRGRTLFCLEKIMHYLYDPIGKYCISVNNQDALIQYRYSSV